MVLCWSWLTVLQEQCYSTDMLKTEPYDADDDVQSELMIIERISNSKVLFCDSTGVEQFENTALSTSELETIQVLVD